MPGDKGIGLDYAQTACLRCREQKLRCTREKPQCARCAKFNITCEFPQPPDRKLIAVRRENNKKRVAAGTVQDESNAVTRGRKKKRSASPPYPYAEEIHTTHGSDTSSVSMNLDMLPEVTRQLFRDVYFACIFNASLTFHRSSFEVDLKNDRVLNHTLLAMYAMAAHLLACSPALSRTNFQALHQVGNLREMSEMWAVEAGKKALQDIDQPTVAAVQTCQILTLYWFARGDTTRNTMFSGIAYKAVRIIILNSKIPRSSCVRDLPPNSASENSKWQKLERLRRCFWASWLTNSVNSDQYTVGGAADTYVLNMPLPSSESDFASNTPGVLRTLKDNQLDKAQKQTGSLTQKSNLMAEVIRIILLWAQIRDHIETRRSSSGREPWYHTFALQDALSSWIKQLPVSLAYSKRHLYEQLVIKEQSIFIFLHTMYHQCCLLLHSSLVPYLSGSLISQESIPPEVARVSAEIALSHAQALSTIGADLISLEWPPTQIAPFVGYSMYVAATIHLTVLSRDERLAESAHGHLASSLKLLKCMKPTWALLETLWQHFQQVYEAVVLKTGVAVTNAAQRLIAPGVEPSKTLDDLEGTEGEAERANELLKDGVTYFGLGQPQTALPGDTISPSKVSTLKNTLDITSGEVISQILDLEIQTSNLTTLPPVVQLSKEKVPSLPVVPATDQQILPNACPKSSMLTISEQPLDEHATLAQANTDAGNYAQINSIGLTNTNSFDNWWQIDTSNSTQLAFPFDDIFSMDFIPQQ